MSVPADRGGVVNGDVEALHETLWEIDTLSWDFFPEPEKALDDIVAAILASDWLAARAQTARAEDAARLAAVEALSNEVHEAPIDLIHERCPAGGVGPGRECTACSAAGRAYLIGVEHVQNDLRAALRTPDVAPEEAEQEPQPRDPFTEARVRAETDELDAMSPDEQKAELTRRLKETLGGIDRG